MRASARRRVANAGQRPDAGGARSQNSSINLGAAFPGVAVVFENQHAGAFPDDLTRAGAVERTAGSCRVVFEFRQFVPHLSMNRLDRMDPRAGRTRDHDVGMAAGDHPQRLADHQIRRRLVDRDRIVRPAGVGGDPDMAGGHIGQEFEQPQGKHLAQADVAPQVVIELMSHGVGTGRLGFGQVFGGAEHQIGTEFDS